MGIVWPNLLLIGANRAGTTTLFHELARHPDIFTGATKETAILTRSAPELDQKKAQLRQYFFGAKNERYVMDASTQYAMIPRHCDVPEKAYRFFGKEIKIIYSLREPIGRLISQMKNEKIYWAKDEVSILCEDIVNKKIGRIYDPYYHSLYYKQLEAWLEWFDRRNILVLVAEEWQTNRHDVFERVGRFLDLDLGPCEQASMTRENAIDELREVPPLAEKFFKSDFYKLRVKRQVPRGAIDAVKRLLPKRRVPETAGLAEIIGQTRLAVELRRSTAQLVAEGFVDPALIERHWGREYVQQHEHA